LKEEKLKKRKPDKRGKGSILSVGGGRRVS